MSDNVLRPPVTQNGAITLSPEQLQEMMRGMAKTLAEELRRPDPETELRMAEQKKREEDNKRANIATMKLEEQIKKCTWGICDHKDKRLQAQGGECYSVACQHRKPDGTSAFAGQVHSDGFVHPFCQRCHYEAPVYRPADSLAQGLGNVT